MSSFKPIAVNTNLILWYWSQVIDQKARRRFIFFKLNGFSKCLDRDIFSSDEMDPANDGHLVVTVLPALNDRSDPLFWHLFLRGVGEGGGWGYPSLNDWSEPLFWPLCMDFPNGRRGCHLQMVTIFGAPYKSISWQILPSYTIVSWLEVKEEFERSLCLFLPRQLIIKIQIKKDLSNRCMHFLSSWGISWIWKHWFSLRFSLHSDKNENTR